MDEKNRCHLPSPARIAEPPHVQLSFVRTRPAVMPSCSRSHCSPPQPLSQMQRAPPAASRDAAPALGTPLREHGRGRLPSAALVPHSNTAHAVVAASIITQRRRDRRPAAAASSQIRRSCWHGRHEHGADYEKKIDCLCPVRLAWHCIQACTSMKWQADSRQKELGEKTDRKSWRKPNMQKIKH
jgi:hypothetical protein